MPVLHGLRFKIKKKIHAITCQPDFLAPNNNNSQWLFLYGLF